MRHIEMVLTDEDIGLVMASLDAQKRAFEGLLQEGKVTPEHVETSKKLVSSFSSLWHKFNWAVNPPNPKKK